MYISKDFSFNGLHSIRNLTNTWFLRQMLAENTFFSSRIIHAQNAEKSKLRDQRRNIKISYTISFGIFRRTYLPERKIWAKPPTVIGKIWDKNSKISGITNLFSYTWSIQFSVKVFFIQNTSAGEHLAMDEKRITRSGKTWTGVSNFSRSQQQATTLLKEN